MPCCLNFQHFFLYTERVIQLFLCTALEGWNQYPSNEWWIKANIINFFDFQEYFLFYIILNESPIMYFIAIPLLAASPGCNDNLFQLQVRRVRIYLVFLWIPEHNPTYRVECTSDPFTWIPLRYGLTAYNTVGVRQALWLSEVVPVFLQKNALLCYLVPDVTKYVK